MTTTATSPTDLERAICELLRRDYGGTRPETAPPDYGYVAAIITDPNEQRTFRTWLAEHGVTVPVPWDWFHRDEVQLGLDLIAYSDPSLAAELRDDYKTHRGRRRRFRREMLCITLADSVARYRASDRIDGPDEGAPLSPDHIGYLAQALVSHVETCANLLIDDPWADDA